MPKFIIDSTKEARLTGDFAVDLQYRDPNDPGRDTATGYNSTIIGGVKNYVNGTRGVIIGGWYNLMTAKDSFTSGGYNIVAGSNSVVFGNANVSSGDNNFIAGGANYAVEPTQLPSSSQTTFTNITEFHDNLFVLGYHLNILCDTQNCSNITALMQHNAQVGSEDNDAFAARSAIMSGYMGWPIHSGELVRTANAFDYDTANNVMAGDGYRKLNHIQHSQIIMQNLEKLTPDPFNPCEYVTDFAVKSVMTTNDSFNSSTPANGLIMKNGLNFVDNNVVRITDNNQMVWSILVNWYITSVTTTQLIYGGIDLVTVKRMDTGTGEIETINSKTIVSVGDGAMAGAHLEYTIGQTDPFNPVPFNPNNLCIKSVGAPTNPEHRCVAMISKIQYMETNVPLLKSEFSERGDLT